MATALLPGLPRSRRDLRLASGLVLFTYITLHLICHALGLVSLGVAEAALHATVLLWHSPLGTLLLYGAAAVHVSLALLAIYDRRTLRLPALQVTRIALGLVMPLALIGHFVGTRYAAERYGLPAEYSRVAAGLWAKGAQGLSLGLLAPGWLHGCLGLRFAFGHRPALRRWHRLFFAAALVLPVLAALGFVTMGRELAAAAARGELPAAPVSATRESGLDAVRDGTLAAYAALIVLVVLGRELRRVREGRSKSVVWIAYPDRRVSVPRGWSVLEASRSFGIAHQAMCGGRARCTTCRVEVVDGGEHCPPPGVDEQRALGCGPDVRGGLRLACQLRPTGDIRIESMLAAVSRSAAAGPVEPSSGERMAALLCFDARVGGGSEDAAVSAHDALYALDRCLAIAQAASPAVTGLVGNGAGWCLLFAMPDGPREAASQALSAARQIERAAAPLAVEPGLRVGFSLVLHVGRVTVGSIGEGDSRLLVAVGPAVGESDAMRQFAAHRGSRLLVSEAAFGVLAMPDDGVQWYRVGAAAGAGQSALRVAELPQAREPAVE